MERDIADIVERGLGELFLPDLQHVAMPRAGEWLNDYLLDDVVRLSDESQGPRVNDSHEGEISFGKFYFFI